MNCELAPTGESLQQLQCPDCGSTVYSSSTRRATCRATGDWCNYRPTGAVLHKLKCQRPECGQVVTSKYADPALRHHPCKVKPEGSSAAYLAWSLAEATAKWIAAGSPVREPDEIADIYQVCVGCPKFKPHESDPDKGSCNECGCRLRKTGGLLNKIKMATEVCPLGKW